MDYQTTARVNLIMRRLAKRPGFLPLVAEGYDECGDTLSKIYRSAYPLIFDTGVDGFDYAIAGTGFLARFRGRLFLITAKHCVTACSGNEIRVACNVQTKSFLPLKMFHLATTTQADNDFADLAIFEADPMLLSEAERNALIFLNLDKLGVGWRFLTPGTKLMIPGFPKELNQVDFDRTKLIEQRYIPAGEFIKKGDDAHTGLFRFLELDQVTSIDGMSGSPVIMIKELNGWYYYSLAGLLIRGGPFFMLGSFIEAGVIMHGLNMVMNSSQ